MKKLIIYIYLFIILCLIISKKYFALFMFILMSIPASMFILATYITIKDNKSKKDNKYDKSNNNNDGDYTYYDDIQVGDTVFNSDDGFSESYIVINKSSSGFYTVSSIHDPSNIKTYPESFLKKL